VLNHFSLSLSIYIYIHIYIYTYSRPSKDCYVAVTLKSMPKGEDASGMLWCCHPHSRLSRLSRGVELQHLLQQHGELQSLSQSTQRMDLLSLGRWPAGLSSEKGAIYSQYEHESMRFETTTGSCGGTLFSGSKPMFSQGSKRREAGSGTCFWWVDGWLPALFTSYFTIFDQTCWSAGSWVL